MLSSSFRSRKHPDEAPFCIDGEKNWVCQALLVEVMRTRAGPTAFRHILSYQDHSALSQKRLYRSSRPATHCQLDPTVQRSHQKVLTLNTPSTEGVAVPQGCPFPERLRHYHVLPHSLIKSAPSGFQIIGSSSIHSYLFFFLNPSALQILLLFHTVHFLINSVLTRFLPASAYSVSPALPSPSQAQTLSGNQSVSITSGEISR